MAEQLTDKSTSPIPALFISNAAYLQKCSGGVQICTQEYLSTLSAAGFSPKTISYTIDRSISTRLKRRLRPRPFADRLPPMLADEIASQAESSEINFIFLNQVDVAPLAMPIRERLGAKCKIILLSHGLESVDQFHAARTDGGGAAFSRVTRRDLERLSRTLIAECQHRQYIDHVFCLSAFEVEIERWLGAKSVSWLPRTIPDNSLEWTPHSSRFGFVGTVDHIPNVEGLVLFLEEFQKIAPDGVRLRLIGGPRAEAEAIAKRFPVVEYLGQLSDEELNKEASTWSSFVHPLFCYSRGCSTKLAIALGWQIPIITTSAGCRGYAWKEGNLPIAESPDALARLALQMLNSEVACKTRQEISAIVRTAPTLADVAAQLRDQCLRLTPTT